MVFSIDRNDRVYALLDSVSCAYDKRNNASAHMSEGLNRDLFLIILVESHVVLSNDEKKGERREEGREKKGKRKKERGEIQGPWQVTKSGV